MGDMPRGMVIHVYALFPQCAIHLGMEGRKVHLVEMRDILAPGASVICALGQRSRTAAVNDLNGSAPFVRVIVDASRVSTITNAVYWGYHAALDI